MMSEDLNKWLHEHVMKECWHEAAPEREECVKCGNTFPSGPAVVRPDRKWIIFPVNPDYLHDPVAYWRLLQKVKEHDSWLVFLRKIPWRWHKIEEIIELFLDPPRGCQAIREFNWEG